MTTFEPPAESWYRRLPAIDLPDPQAAVDDFAVWTAASKAVEQWREQAYYHAVYVLVPGKSTVTDAKMRREMRAELVKALARVEAAADAFHEWNELVSGLLQARSEARKAELP